MKKSLSLFSLILINVIFCQQNEYFIDAIIDPDKRIIKIDQEIVFFNNSNHEINYLILTIGLTPTQYLHLLLEKDFPKILHLTFKDLLKSKRIDKNYSIKSRSISK
jgi:hypothetical protein